LSLGVGKSATAHIIHSAAAAYSDRGFKCVFFDSLNIIIIANVETPDFTMLMNANPMELQPMGILTDKRMANSTFTSPAENHKVLGSRLLSRISVTKGFQINELCEYKFRNDYLGTRH
jgi:hypothetical protein